MGLGFGAYTLNRYLELRLQVVFGAGGFCTSSKVQEIRGLAGLLKEQLSKLFRWDGN